MVGKDWMLQCVGEIVTDICGKEEVSMEIDPSKTPEAEVPKNMVLLKQKCEDIFSRIIAEDMLVSMPMGIKCVSESLQMV